MKGAGLMASALLAAGCAHATTNASYWPTKATDFSGYTPVSPDQAAGLIARAEADFRVSPLRLYPEDDGARPLLLRRAARRPDGRTLIAFYVDHVSDMYAIYVFNAEGEIIDRYIHSFWGPPVSQRGMGRR